MSEIRDGHWTLSQIIEAAKNGGMIPNIDLLYAVCALESLWIFDNISLRNLSRREAKAGIQNSLGTAQNAFEVSFSRAKTVLSQKPIEWLGWDNDPFNPEYQKRRQIALKLWDKCITKGGS